MDRRYLSLIFALIIIVSTLGIANAAPTNNVKVDWLVDKGIVKGYEGIEDLKLMDTITRAEAVAMIVRVQGLETFAQNLKFNASKLKDVKTTHWANGYINVAVANGVVNGYPDGTFRPEDKVTYAEIIKMLVIANGDLPAINGLVAWEVPYITKALEVGILEDITIESYNDYAIRGKVFEMVYNLMDKDALIGLELYKGIVIENARVSGLDKNEIAIEVIERNSGSNDYRYNKGSNVRVNLSNINADTDYLLGKVIDIAISKNNETSRLVIDNSYAYLRGQTIVGKDKLIINGKTYNVIDTNKRENNMDKLAAIFHNDKEYIAFKDYYEKIGNSKEFTNDFSNVTIKDNNILFIDSFTFEDIAVVKDVFKSGNEVYIYKDETNGSISKFTPYSLLGYSEEGIKSMELKDIKANDVVHIYNRDKAIVRVDALRIGAFDSYTENTGSSYIQVSGKNYIMDEVDKRRPVYSLDGTRFFTLFANSGDLDLEQLRGKKVTILLDVNNKLQSIVGNLKYDEGVFVVDETTRRSFNVIDPNNERTNAIVGRNSLLNYLGSIDNKSTEHFFRGDLVYLMKDGNTINKMVRMGTAMNINSQAKPVTKSSKGNFEISKDGIILEEDRGLTSNFIINKANVFIIEVDGNNVSRIHGTTLDDIMENTKLNSDLKAYVITNRDFNIMNIGNNIRFGYEADVAHTIIFTNFENTSSNLTRKVVEVIFKYTPEKSTVIEGKDINGETVIRNVNKLAKIPVLELGDFVELRIGKDGAIEEAVLKVTKNDKTFKVIEVDKFSPTRDRQIILEDSNKIRKEFYILKDANDFGKVQKGDIVSVNFNLNGDIDVIVVRNGKISVNGAL